MDDLSRAILGAIIAVIIWATQQEQRRNTRNSNIYHVKGKSFNLSDASNYFNAGKSTIRYWCKTKENCFVTKKYA